MALLLFLSIGNARAQDINSAVVAAFSASYSAETAKDYDKAISSVKSVYSENFYEANLRLGWLCYLKKDYMQAQTYYRLAMRIRPASVEAMFGFINPAAAALNWTDVFSTYQKILAIDPNSSLANYRIALMYYYRKDFASAEKHLQRIWEHYPFDYDTLLLMAQVKLAAGKLSESKQFYQRALLYNPANEEIRKVLSRL